MKISQKTCAISPSLTLEMTAKAKKMKAEGISVIGFTAGEPDFNTPQYIIDSAKVALDTGFTKYTPASGMLELKKAICEKFKKDNGLDYNPSQIVISSGAKSSLYHAICAMVEEGDEVIIPSPYWLTYPELVKLAGGKCVFVKTKKENGYKITVEELKNAITNKTSLLILNSPNNPTGAVYSKDELLALGKVVEESGISVVSDEIYEKLIYNGKEFCSIASLSDYLKEHTVIINGVSKTYSMTGWRIGYLAAPENLAKAISSMQSHTTSNACSISQFASVTALTSPESAPFIEKMVRTFDERRKYIVNFVKEIKGLTCAEPDGAFYVFIDVSAFYGKTYKGEKIEGSLSFSEALLRKGVAVIPGVCFGDDNAIRLSSSVALEDIKEGLKRIKEFTEELV